VKRRVLLVAAITALAAAAGTWFFENYEIVDGQVYVGYQGEARRDPLLAAERLLGGLGYHVETLDSLAGLGRLPERGTLVLSADRWPLPPPALHQLLQWVRRGNGLIVEAKPGGVADPLSDAMGIVRTYVSGTTGPRSRTETDTVGEPAPGSAVREPDIAGQAYTMPWPPQRTYRIGLARWQTLDVQGHPVQFSLSDERGSYVLGFFLDQGRVVVFNSFMPLYNWSIGNADNAPFFAQVAAHAGGGGTVLFLHNPARASLWDWLWSHAAIAVLSAVVLIGLSLWRSAVRFGPALPDPPAARRRWIDHIEASGQFLWKRGGRARLSARARAAAFADIDHRIPGFGRLSGPARSAVLVRRFRLTPAEAALLLGPLPDNAAAVTAEARLLRRLHQMSRPDLDRGR